MTSLRFALIGCCAWLLAACSGGGGGGGGGGGAGQFSVAQNSIAFEADIDGATPLPVTINGSITGVSSNSTVYLTVLLTNRSISNANVELTGETTGRLVVFPRSPASLGFGTFSDTVTVSACLDPGCARQVSGSPKTIAVTYNVRGLKVTPSGAVNLSAAEGAAATPVQVSLQNAAAGAWTSSITYQGATSGWLNLTPTGGPVGSGQTLSLSANALTTPGTYNASVRLSSGNSATIVPVTYTVAPNLSVAPTSLSLTAVTGQTAPPIGLSTAVSAARGTAFTTSVTYGSGASGWLAVSGSSAPGTLSVLPQTVALSPGVYNATVTLTPTAGTPITVPVTYTLAPSELTFNPGAATFRIDASSTNAPSFVQRTVQIADTGAPLTWTTQESSPWLQVTASGSSGQTAQVTVLPAALETMPNGTHTATINFISNGPSVSNQVRSLTVELTLQLPTIVYAMPYVAYLNEQQPLILRGSGFDQAGMGPVMFGGVAAQSSEVISDSVIRVVPPPFATPARPVISIANNLGLDRTDAELVARAKPVYGSHEWDFAIGMPSGARVVYDAERDYVFSMRHFVGIDPPANTRESVLRFELDPLGTSADFTFRKFPWLEDIGLSPNGKTLFVLTTTQLHFVDPETMLDLAPAITVANIDGRTGRLVVVNDGKIVLPNLSRSYQPLTNTFAPLEQNLNWVSNLAVSADGSRIAFGTATGSSVTLGTYDSSTGQVSLQSSTGFLSQLSLNRSGTLIAHGGEVLNSDFTVYGSSAAEYFSILSPAGNRLFDMRFSPSRFHVFDTTSPASPLLELPVIPAAFGPGARGISLNGEHLFVIDPDRISVIRTQ